MDTSGGDPLPIDDVNILVTFYSRGGLTERIAVWLAEGAVQAGAKIRLRRARDIAAEEAILADPEWAANRDRMHEEFAAPTEADAEWAHVLAFGVPVSGGSNGANGLMSAELGAYLDRFSPGALRGKIGTGFTSSYVADANPQSALTALQRAMDGLGLTVFAPSREMSSSSLKDWDLAHAQGHQVVATARAGNREDSGSDSN